MNDFQLNDVVVRPRLNEIRIDGRNEKLPAKFIDVLMVLAERQGEVLGKAELLKRVWNDPLIGEESLSNAVWMLRKTLGDDAKRPAYIETVPRRGYRLIARVARLCAEPLPDIGAGAEAMHTVALPLDEPARVSDERPTALPTAPASQRTHGRRPHLPLWRLLVLLAVTGSLLWWLLASERERLASAATVLAFRTGGNLSTITLADAGTVLVADGVGHLYAVDTRQGTERWRFSAARRSQVSPQPMHGRLFIGSEDSYLYALDFTTGRELWRHATGHSVQAVPLARDGQVIYADISGRVRALRSDDAAPIWETQLDNRVVGAIVGPLDLAVLRTLNGTLVAFDRGNGGIRWQRSFEGPLSDLVAASDAQVMLASDAGFVAAVAASNGSIQWQAPLPAAGIKPLVIADRAYALGRYGDMVALRLADGAELWRVRLKIGDPRDLVWWSDRIVVILDDGVLGLIDPDDGSIERSLRLPETPEGLVADGSRLIVTAQSGRAIAIDRDALDRLEGSQIRIDDDAQLHAQDVLDLPASGGKIEALSVGARLPELQWQFPVLGHVQDIAVDSEGDAYLSDERSVFSLTAAGATRWRKALRPAMGTQCALAEEHVYFGRRDRVVYALERDSGKQIWAFTTGAQVISPPTVAGGRVYVGSDDRHLYALDADTGAVLWSFETKRPVRGAAVVAQNRVVFGSADRNVYALDATTGDLLWQFTAEDWVVAYPLHVAGRIFVGTGHGEFHALDLLSGKPLWKFRTGGKIWFRPTADGERVFFGSGDGHIYALDQATGIERWRRRTGAAAEGSVVLAAGVIYAGSHDFHLYALDSRNGQALWRLRTGGSVFNPAVGNGMLFVASGDQQLYALKL